jgi:transcriptional regulator with XRE-family HTH domain
MPNYPITDAPTLLRDMRETAKLSTRELARRLGKMQPAVVREERGNHHPTVETLRLRAKACGFEITLQAVKRP